MFLQQRMSHSAGQPQNPTQQPGFHIAGFGKMAGEGALAPILESSNETSNIGISFDLKSSVAKNPSFSNPDSKNASNANLREVASAARPAPFSPGRSTGDRPHQKNDDDFDNSNLNSVVIQKKKILPDASFEGQQVHSFEPGGHSPASGRTPAEDGSGENDLSVFNNDDMRDARDKSDRPLKVGEKGGNIFFTKMISFKTLQNEEPGEQRPQRPYNAKSSPVL